MEPIAFILAGTVVGAGGLWMAFRERQKLAAMLASETEALTRLELAETRVRQLEQEVKDAVSAKEAAVNARQESETSIAVMQERLQASEARIKDWESVKSEMQKQAEASLYKVSKETAAQLIDSHKKERVEMEEKAKTHQQEMTKQVEQLAKSVAVIQSDAKTHAEQTGQLWRALSSPAGAGYFAEIGLQNTLEGFGLVQGRDFLIQQTVAGEEGRQLRPDAIVFLPSRVLVIDCKASKFILEHAASDSPEAEAKALEALKKTMTRHLSSLTGKDYRGAVQAACKEMNRKPQKLVTLMYLPSDGASERVRKAWPEFGLQTADEDIILAGPTGLIGVIHLVKTEIMEVRQAENQEKIIEAAQSLLEGIGFAFTHAGKVWKGLQAATDGFSQFAKSVNSRLLPRARKLMALGLSPQNIPASLPEMQLIKQTLEGDAEVVSLPYEDNDSATSSAA